MPNEKKNVMVVQSNDLIEAYYSSDLTATEHKIIRYAASKIKQNPKQFPRVEFTVTEFLDAAGIKGNAYHSKIKQVTKQLASKTIDISPNDESGAYFPWFSGIVYMNGMVYIEFNEKIKPLLLHLEGEYTKYSYRYIGDMKSGYSIRLFELLKQYAPIGRRRIKVDTLKKMLGIADKYEKYAQFKLRVLNQAKKELDKKEGLTFEFEEIKQGRKVTELIFHINTKEKQLSFEDIDSSNDENIFMKEAKLLLDNYDFDIPDRVIATWSKYGIDLLSSVLEEIKDREIQHPPAYITAVLNAKYEARQEIVATIEAEDDEKRIVTTFIENNKFESSAPDWMIKLTFNDKLKDYLKQEEIETLWKKNKDYIIKKTRER